MLLQFDPFREIDRMADQAVARNAAPAMAMDALRRGETVHIFLDLPGVDPASIDLEVERNVLTVKAARRWAREEGDQVPTTATACWPSASPWPRPPSPARWPSAAPSAPRPSRPTPPKPPDPSR